MLIDNPGSAHDGRTVRETILIMIQEGFGGIPEWFNSGTHGIAGLDYYSIRDFVLAELDATRVTLASPIKVLGNGLGYLHLGAAAGPRIQPLTQMEQGRQLVFPIGAKLTATCPDNSDSEAFSRPVFGGLDANGNWALSQFEWVHMMGMDIRHYDAMKVPLNKKQLVDDALRDVDLDLVLTRTNGIAIDSAAWVTKATSHACDVNDVKQFTFLGTERARITATGWVE